MFNTYPLNQSLLNIWTNEVQIQTSTLSFNWYDLDQGAFRLKNIIWIDDSVDIDFNTYSRANADGQWIDSIYYRQKTITIEGVLVASSPWDLDQEITSLKSSMSKRNKKFIYIRRNWDIVETTANCVKVSVLREFFHIDFVPVTMEIVTVDPFFYGQERHESSWTGLTSDLSTTVLYSWGEVYTRPYIQININSATSVTQIEITLWGNTITIDSTFSSSDVIAIDCKEKKVTLNSTQSINYTGIFPKLERWETQLDLNITGTHNTDLYVLRNDTYA